MLILAGLAGYSPAALPFLALALAATVPAAAFAAFPFEPRLSQGLTQWGHWLGEGYFAGGDSALLWGLRSQLSGELPPPGASLASRLVVLVKSLVAALSGPGEEEVQQPWESPPPRQKLVDGAVALLGLTLALLAPEEATARGTAAASALVLALRWRALGLEMANLLLRGLLPRLLQLTEVALATLPALGSALLAQLAGDAGNAVFQALDPLSHCWASGTLGETFAL